MKPFEFATKATTLERLAPSITRARLCEQLIVSAAAWRDDRRAVVTRVVERFAPALLAIRSSAAGEDGWDNSLAGAHLSRTDVAPTPGAVGAAVDAVFDSYTTPSPEDQVLVQPMVGDVVISGVVLTRDLDTGSPYYVVNYDDFSGRTDTVTGGAESKTLLVHRARPDALKSPRIRKLVEGVIEIEAITGSGELDIEFCITGADDVYILQVRPLAAKRRWLAVPDGAVDAALNGIRAAIAGRMAPKPGLAGGTTILGEMPDWNPAEMIGNAPRPLALSLYKYLITDRMWADARARMGYRQVNEPLMIDFHGRPYIDTRHSFNSFLPADIEEDLAGRLIDYQLDRLATHPLLHDKIEFEIAITCRDFDFGRDARRLEEAGFESADIEAFENSLGALTAAALAARDGEIPRLLALSNSLLGPRHDLQALPPLQRLRHLLDDCKRLGTLPFSELARHGFIAMLFLKSLVRRGVFSPADADAFMHGIHTVAADLVGDMHATVTGAMDRASFLARYGHLRPGTYDILSWRYDERPQLYLGHAGREAPAAADVFTPSAAQHDAIDALLGEFAYPLSSRGLLDYIAASVKAREESKFAFTRSISDALSILAAWGESVGFSRDDLSFLPIGDLLDGSDVDRLKAGIERERETYKLTRAIRLPHLIREPADIDVVKLPLGQPTFITAKTITAKAKRLASGDSMDIDDHIVLIEGADPGFDWIFSHAVSGLITKYGGANSHMAIRCAEFGLPAAIGCGERLFETLAKAPVVQLDCAAGKLSGH